MVSELYLEAGYEGLLSVHALHRFVSHCLLEVALGEELCVDQLGALLHVHPVLEEFVNFDIDVPLIVKTCPHFRELNHPFTTYNVSSVRKY